MKLEQIRQMVVESRRADWLRIHPPLFHHEMGNLIRSGVTEVEVGAHYYSLVYRADVNLTVEVGLPMDRDDTRQFDFAERFVNPKASCYYVDIFWAGSLVDRYSMIALDGGHKLLPFPHTGGSQETGWVDQVHEREVEVARLLASVDGSYDPIDGALSTVGFVVVPDED